MLALFSVTLTRRLRTTTTHHLNTLLLIAFSIYFYRDIWPYATFTTEPLDMRYPWFTWSSIALLFFSGLLIPLTVPHEYVPLDANSPNEPNSEQTASLVSFLLFSFLDPIVFKAYRVPHLPYEDLPPLADYDRAEHLIHKSFKKVDPELRKGMPRRHLLWGLLITFGKIFSSFWGLLQRLMPLDWIGRVAKEFYWLTVFMTAKVSVLPLLIEHLWNFN